jgi:macrolide phosphotransferase
VTEPDAPPASGGPAGGVEELAALARRAAPDLELSPVTLVDNGWDNRVLFADAADGSRWVFRFPRRPDVLPDVDREARLLAMLQGRLPVAVPDWRLHADVDGTRVIGYPALPGTPAGYEPGGIGDFSFVLALPPPDTYGRSLGAALAALHSVPVGDVTAATGRPAPSADDLRRRTAAQVDSCLAAVPVPAVVADRWRGWLADNGLWEFRPVLRHGDVHPEHTLVGPDGTVTAIIDWTDADCGDPADDFIDARHAFGAEFGDLLLRRYAEAGGRPDRRLADRVVARQAWGAVTAALFGLANERPEITARAVQRIAAQAVDADRG